VITMRQRPLENTRTPQRSSIFEAECEVDGQRYSARSRHGAPNKLARLLVSAGVADQPVEVRHAGIKGCLSWRSLHEMAHWTLPAGRFTPVLGNTSPASGGEIRQRSPAHPPKQHAGAFLEGGAGASFEHAGTAGRGHAIDGVLSPAASQRLDAISNSQEREQRSLDATGERHRRLRGRPRRSAAM
jgi:hypothetical protein